MTDINPYQAPTAAITDSYSDENGTASRQDRFFAALIDGVIACCYAFPLMFQFGLWERIKNGAQPSLLEMLPYIASCLAAYLVLHGYFLYSNGQTIGKKLLGIRIVTLDGEKASFSCIILRRFLPIYGVGLIPVVGNILVLIDSLFIFRKDRRCLHDHIAETRVVDC